MGRFIEFFEFVDSLPDDDPLKDAIAVDDDLVDLYGSILYKLNELGWPSTVNSKIFSTANLRYRQSTKRIAWRFGYEKLVNLENSDGRWRIDGDRVSLYKKINKRK